MTTAELHSQAADVLQRYLSVYPDERGDLHQLDYQLHYDHQDVFSRSNTIGHITASGFILDHDFANVLLIDHPYLRIWIPPGGHVEPGCTSLWGAAVDEVHEETGLDSVAPYKLYAPLGLPLDIDTHPIPANPKKREGPHFHHDFMFLGVAAQGAVPAPLAGDAVQAAKWYPLAHLLDLPGARMKRVAKKVNLLLGKHE